MLAPPASPALDTTDAIRLMEIGRRFDVILEGVSDGITIQDLSGRIVYANLAAARSCGCASVNELLAMAPSEVVARFELYDEAGHIVSANDLPSRRVLGGANSATSVMRIRMRDSGRQWWNAIRSSAVYDEEGNVELVVNIWHDVTASRRREEYERYLAKAATALSASLDGETMLRALASMLSPGLSEWCLIHVRDKDRLQTVAVAHADSTKLDAARAHDRKRPPDPHAARGVWKVIRTGEPELIEDVSEELSKAGARDVAELATLHEMGAKSLVIAPIRVRDSISGAITLASAGSGRRYDTMDLALAEELGRRAGTSIENARLYAEATRAARAAEEASRVKDQFLATVSHELRTPLNAIVGWSALLREGNTDPAATRGLDVIHRNAKAQARIIEDILDVSRIITGKLKLDLRRTDLAAIVHDAVEVMRPSAAAKEVTLELSPPEGSSAILADPERLQQVVWNLLSNAVKFTDAGGKVTVAITREPGKLGVSVTDTGCGIDQEFLPFVFDRFKQADASTTRRVGGLGLGLSIVRHIVELHGGRVDAASGGMGRGSTFSIMLPIRAAVPAVQDSAAPPRPAAPPRRSPLSGLRVLVVDDEEDARDLLQILLEQAGAEVCIAASAAEALMKLERFHPEVLVSDIAMPNEDGYELMRRTRALERAKGGAVPSIALTAYVRAEDRTKALEAGFTTHIGKPVNPDDLLSAVANLAKLSPMRAEH